MKERLCVGALALVLANADVNLAGYVAQQGAPDKPAETSPDLAEASRLSRQVVTLHNQGKFDEALPLAKQALEIRQKRLGSEHQLVGVALKNLASLYFAKKQYDEAAHLYQRTLSVYEKVFGDDDPKTADILDNLAWSSYANRDTGKAERSLLRALSIREKALGPDSRDVGEAFYVLGQFYQKVGNSKKAVDFYKRALPIKEKTLGANHKDFLTLLEKCSCALLQIGRKEEAAEMQKRMRTDTPPSGSVRRSGVVLQGSATVRAEPIYPPAARNERVSGTVIVEVIVDESGKVINARPVCGPDLLVRAAVDAAWKWRFTPTTLDGAPVKVIGTITFNFHL